MCPQQKEGKNMIHVKATNKVEVHRIECLLQLKVNEKRPDLVWFLWKLGRWGMSSGEERNMEGYLEFLNLVRDGELTNEGDKALETGNVMVPEAGLYELLYVIDKIFGERIISYQRKEPRDILEGNTQGFSDFTYFDEKVHPDLSAKDKKRGGFWIQFQRQRNETPKVITTGTLEAGLTVTFDLQSDAKRVFRFEKNKRMITHEESLSSFNIDRNLTNWIKGWDASIRAREMTYEEVKENPATLNGFIVTMLFQGKSLHVGEAVDDSDWDVEITIPVVPRSKKDAENWLYHLLFDDLTKNARYLSIEHLEHLVREKIKGTPIDARFKNFLIPGKKLLAKMKKEEDNRDPYWRVMAVEDLVSSSEFAGGAL